MRAMRLLDRQEDLPIDLTVSQQAERYADSFHALVEDHANLELIHEGRAGEPEKLPRELVKILARVVEAVAKGGTVSIGTMPKELTTTAAAGDRKSVV